MARAKYKLGTLVQTDSGTGTEYGVVTGITTKAAGYSYHLDDSDTVVEEDSITNAFRPIIARKVAAKKVAKKPARKPRAEQESEAAE